MLNKEKLIEHCKKCGADLVGVASIDRFEGVEAAGDPRFILPRVKSVIVLVHSIPRGWVRGYESHSDWETAYKRGGFLDSSLTIEIAYNICTYIEDCGFDAVPLYQYPIEMRGHGVKVKPGNPEPDVVIDTMYAAHAAGLGQFGKCGLFLTPEFGPRQQFTTILTNAELEADEIQEKSICDNCGECASACPARAISELEYEKITQTNGETTVSKIMLQYCRNCKTGAVANSFLPNAAPERMFAACGRACMAHLEDAHMLKYRFENDFRRKTK